MFGGGSPLGYGQSAATVSLPALLFLLNSQKPCVPPSSFSTTSVADLLFSLSLSLSILCIWSPSSMFLWGLLSNKWQIKIISHSSQPTTMLDSMFSLRSCPINAQEKLQTLLGREPAFLAWIRASCLIRLLINDCGVGT